MLSLAVHAATAQYDSLANLDTSAEGLAAATTTVTIGAAPNFWYIPVSPYPPYTVCVGDKLSFMYGVAHNVWLMTDGPDCDYPFKGLSGCGVGYKLIQAVLDKLKRDPAEAHVYLDLVSVSTASVSGSRNRQVGSTICTAQPFAAASRRNSYVGVPGATAPSSSTV